MKYRCWAAVALMTLAPGVALAAGTATFAGKDGKPMHVAWRAGDMLRMDVPGQSTYMIARDGKLYSVADDNGTPRVIEMSGMLKAMTAMASNSSGNGKLLDSQVQSVQPTGKTPTVAGIKGVQYRVTVKQGDGTSKTVDMVLTDNPLVVEMTHAYVTTFEPMVGDNRMDHWLAKLPAGERGVLQVGNEFRLTSISGDTPPASDFTLPAKPQNIGDMMQKMLRQMKPQQAAPQQ